MFSGLAVAADESRAADGHCRIKGKLFSTRGCNLQHVTLGVNCQVNTYRPDWGSTRNIFGPVSQAVQLIDGTQPVHHLQTWSAPIRARNDGIGQESGLLTGRRIPDCTDRLLSKFLGTLSQQPAVADATSVSLVHLFLQPLNSPHRKLA
ncbi:hypothetical protein CGCF413_v005277 [Colletotrichum fructicola]|nr:hypothetical protein CGCF413_v005277 [Colletotrichum fructicola]